MEKIIVGEYKTRFIGDSDLKLTVNVISRTAKQVTFKVDGETEVKKAKLHIFENEEYFYPLGKYSMAPTIRMDNCIRF